MTGSFEHKKQYREYRARVAALPEPYRTSAEAVERYLMHVGGISDGAIMVRMLDDLISLVEEHAASNTPIREVVGEDPVEFVQDFLANYADAMWINKERRRLNDAIAKAAGES
ncbi:MAG: DUF1048 domain-containing protein [Pseudoclavibacter sp.]